MNQLLQRLVLDHKHMTVIHDCMKNEMHAFDSETRAANWQILLDIMDYLRTYEEVYHHPIEDQVYRLMRLSVVDPFLLQMLDHIEIQHAQLHVLSRRFEGDLLAITNDQVVPKRRLMSDYQGYIELAEEHLTCENKYLFPAIEAHLDPDSVNTIVTELVEEHDPLFSEHRLRGFDRLHDYLSSVSAVE